jgi:DNA-binding MarR family transcriptional regulator
MTQDRRKPQPGGAGSIPTDDVDAVTNAVLDASRVLVAISARALAALHESVTLPQLRALVVLSTSAPLKVAALAEELGVNSSTAVRMVDRLVAAGMVSREVNQDSRREVLLRLTPAGDALVEEVTARRRAEIARIVARMPDAARTGLMEALQHFSEVSRHPRGGTATE